MLYIKPAPCIISNWEQRTGFGAEIVINDHCELPSPRQTLKNAPPPQKKIVPFSQTLPWEEGGGILLFILTLSN